MRSGSNPQTCLRKALTVSSEGEVAVKYLGFAGGSGSFGGASGAAAAGGAVRLAGGTWTLGVWGAGAEGTAAGAWANATDAVRGKRNAAVRTADRFFNDFLL